MVLLFATGFSKYINDEFYTRHAVCSTVFISFGISMFQRFTTPCENARKNDGILNASICSEMHPPTTNTALHTHSSHFRQTERTFRSVLLIFLFRSEMNPAVYNDEICIQSNKFARTSNALHGPPTSHPSHRKRKMHKTRKDHNLIIAH